MSGKIRWQFPCKYLSVNVDRTENKCKLTKCSLTIVILYFQKVTDINKRTKYFSFRKNKTKWNHLLFCIRVSNLNCFHLNVCKIFENLTFGLLYRVLEIENVYRFWVSLHANDEMSSCINFNPHHNINQTEILLTCV